MNLVIQCTVLSNIRLRWVIISLVLIISLLKPSTYQRPEDILVVSAFHTEGVPDLDVLVLVDGELHEAFCGYVL